MIHVEFLENASFKSYDGVCWSSRSSLLDKLSMYKRDSDGWLSTRVVYRSSYASHDLTDPWLSTYLLKYICVLFRTTRGLDGWHSQQAHAFIVCGHITRCAPMVLHHGISWSYYVTMYSLYAAAIMFTVLIAIFCIHFICRWREFSLSKHLFEDKVRILR